MRSVPVFPASHVNHVLYQSAPFLHYDGMSSVILTPVPFHSLGLHLGKTFLPTSPLSTLSLPPYLADLGFEGLQYHFGYFSTPDLIHL